jgi:spore photoproduct lyase
VGGSIGGAPVRVGRRTRFIEILRTTPPRTVCPNFYMLSHANGCAFEPACDYCYLQSTLWYLDAARVFTNVEDLAAEVRAWIARDELESTVLNTGNLSDSLGFEHARPLVARLVELFRFEAERKGRPHTLLLVTKGGRNEAAPLAGLEPSANVVVSFSLNAPEAAVVHERGAPPVEERLAAAAALKSSGWRIRIRIDPMIAGYSYTGIAARVGGIAPERVTLGCLRADRGLLRKGDGVFASLKPLEVPGGLARYPAAERIRLYREAIDALPGRSTVGLCEETADVWTAVGLDPDAKTCNCAS